MTGAVEPHTPLAISRGGSIDQNRTGRKTRGFRGISSLPAPVGFPIKTVGRI